MKKVFFLKFIPGICASTIIMFQVISPDSFMIPAIITLVHIAKNIHHLIQNNHVKN